MDMICVGVTHCWSVQMSHTYSQHLTGLLLLQMSQLLTLTSFAWLTIRLGSN